MTELPALSVASLRVEHQVNPLGLDEPEPVFSWTIASTARGVRQTGYQIRVADHPDNLQSALDLIWDSGHVESDRSLDVEFAGPKLRSRRRYYWSVRVSTTAGDSNWSPAGWWEMGLLESSDWAARWVRPTQEARQPNPARPETMEGDHQAARVIPLSLLRPAQYLRREFELRGSITRARVYATAHGVYRLEINGTRVGDQELAPEWTAYDDYLMYQVYDVAGLLNDGPNAIGMVIADGWYAGRVGYSGEPILYGDHVEGLVQVEVEYADGRTEIIGTDSSFTSSTGAVRYSDMLIGERYDAREEQPGWSSPGFDASRWVPVAERDYPMDNLVASYGEPVRVVAELPAQRVTTSPAGETIVDFGQAVAGRTRMRISGPGGTEVRLSHTEVLDAEGNYFFNIVNQAGPSADATDVYVLKGDGVEEFEAAFTYYGFRYVKVEGHPGQVRPEDFTAVVLSSDTEQTFTLETDNADVNQLFGNIIATHRANMLSIPTDNPDRERAGWTGDFQAIAPSVMTTLGLQSFTTRWLRNLQKEQHGDGGVPQVIPALKGYFDQPLYAWGDVCVIAPWVAYQAYGDVRLLRENYRTGQRWLEWSAAAAAQTRTSEDNENPELSHLWRPTTFGFGDWLVPSLVELDDRRLYTHVSALRQLIPTLYWARSAQLMARMADVLGETADAQRYAELFEAIARSFRAAFVTDEGRLVEDKQGNYVLALEFGVVLPEQRQRMFDRLVELIDEQDPHLDTGFLSTAFLLPLLTRNGRSDLSYRLLLTDSNPSWLYQVRHGATTVWEMWDSVREDGMPTRTSYIQPGLSTVVQWLAESVAGISASSPGYREILIHPVPVDGVGSATSSVISPYGVVSTCWRTDESHFLLDVTVPSNTRARVVIDEATVEGSTEAGLPISESQAVKILTGGPAVELVVGSGRYSFRFRRDPVQRTS